ncbi:hypothetical protein CSR02_14490 [Acetobacter pomorum]|uniref:Uncharacterized protein n=1 Tax=Acetobacter pomorum TaxID=65959 RepID=A0A2G4R8F6_9PROT|nr:hypothetical protein [Acetobacter pomorum]PHY92834.1 hypothetical protein CSR02_14490 [Acetobacter pomorum]GBR51694.1 hypothetical protein AA11825_2047 [Acetobacter pomorum DSM 11825]
MTDTRKDRLSVEDRATDMATTDISPFPLSNDVQHIMTEKDQYFMGHDLSLQDVERMLANESYGKNLDKTDAAGVRVIQPPPTAVSSAQPMGKPAISGDDFSGLDEIMRFLPEDASSSVRSAVEAARSGNMKLNNRVKVIDLNEQVPSQAQVPVAVKHEISSTPKDAALEVAPDSLLSAIKSRTEGLGDTGDLNSSNAVSGASSPAVVHSSAESPAPTKILTKGEHPEPEGDQLSTGATSTISRQAGSLTKPLSPSSPITRITPGKATIKLVGASPKKEPAHSSVRDPQSPLSGAPKLPNGRPKIYPMRLVARSGGINVYFDPKKSTEAPANIKVQDDKVIVRPVSNPEGQQAKGAVRHSSMQKQSTPSNVQGVQSETEASVVIGGGPAQPPISKEGIEIPPTVPSPQRGAGAPLKGTGQDNDLIENPKASPDQGTKAAQAAQLKGLNTSQSFKPHPGTSSTGQRALSVRECGHAQAVQTTKKRKLKVNADIAEKPKMSGTRTIRVREIEDDEDVIGEAEISIKERVLTPNHQKAKKSSSHKGGGGKQRNGGLVGEIIPPSWLNSYGLKKKKHKKSSPHQPRSQKKILLICIGVCGLAVITKTFWGQHQSLPVSSIPLKTITDEYDDLPVVDPHEEFEGAKGGNWNQELAANPPVSNIGSHIKDADIPNATHLQKQDIPSKLQAPPPIVNGTGASIEKIWEDGEAEANKIQSQMDKTAPKDDIHPVDRIASTPQLPKGMVPAAEVDSLQSSSKPAQGGARMAKFDDVKMYMPSNGVYGDLEGLGIDTDNLDAYNSTSTEQDTPVILPNQIKQPKSEAVVSAGKNKGTKHPSHM